MPPPSIIDHIKKAGGGALGVAAGAEGAAEPYALEPLWGAARNVYTKMKEAERQADFKNMQYYSAIGARLKTLIEERQPKINVPADMAASAVSGTVEGASELVGLPRGVKDLMASMNSPETEKARQELNKMPFGLNVPFPEFPTSKDALKAVPGAEAVASYKPESDEGRYTKEGFRLVPSAVALGGAKTFGDAVASGFKLGFVPGVIGEKAQESFPEDWKPWVRALGNVGGGVGASVLGNWAKSAVATPRETFKPLIAAAEQAYTKATTVAAQDSAVRMGLKATKLDRIMEVAKVGSSWGKASVADKIREGFKALDQEITNTTVSNVGHKLWTDAEIKVIKQVAEGLPVERALQALGNASTDLRALLGGAAAGAGFTTWRWLTEGVSPGPAIVGAAIPAGLAATGSAFKSASRAQQAESLNALSRTVGSGGKEVIRLPAGRLNPVVISNYAAPAIVPLPPDTEDKYR